MAYFNMEFSNLTGFDITIFSIIILAILFGFLKGFIKSLGGLLGWVLSGYLTLCLYQKIAIILTPHIKNIVLLNLVSTAGLFILLLIIISIISNQIYGLIDNMIGGIVDRTLGAGFGFIKGCLFSCVIFWIVITFSKVLDESKQPAWLSEARSYKLLKSVNEMFEQKVLSNESTKELLEFLKKTKDNNIQQAYNSQLKII